MSESKTPENDSVLVSQQQCDDFQRDGAVLIKGVFKDWVSVIEAGIAGNMATPSEYASENAVAAGQGRFFDDYCNWQCIPEFEQVIRNSPAAEVAASIMQSKTVQFFHDHVLVKEGGTAKPTPWHQDSPYYFVEGEQTVSFWIPVDPVKESSLRLIAGSHRWTKPVRPVSWADNSDFYDQSADWMAVPDPDVKSNELTVLEWQMEPGDVVLFDFRTVHGARGNHSNTNRRALSLRWVGDDARYVERSGRTSPPYPGHTMQAGQVLREDWFPVLFRQD